MTGYQSVNKPNQSSDEISNNQLVKLTTILKNNSFSKKYSCWFQLLCEDLVLFSVL